MRQERANPSGVRQSIAPRRTLDEPRWLWLAGAIVVSFVAMCAYLQGGSMVEDPLRPGKFVFVGAEGTGMMYLRGAAAGIIIAGSLVTVMRPSSTRRLPDYWWPAIVMAGGYAASWYFRIDFTVQQVFVMGVTATAPAVWIILLVTVMETSDDGWKQVCRVALVIGWVALVLAAYHTLALPDSGRRQAGSNPATRYMGCAFWFAMYAMLLDRGTKFLSSMQSRLAVCACLALAVISQSRGWVVLGLVSLCARWILDVLYPGRSKKLFTWVFAAVALAMIGGSVFSRLSGSFELLLDRLDQDTRSAQYIAYFEQFSIADLVVGVGPDAAYVFGRGYYGWIDNQYLVTLMKFGLPVLLGYVILVLLPGWRILIQWRKNPLLPEGMLIGLWTLALGGLSTFNAIDITPHNLLICAVAGRCARRLGARYSLPDQQGKVLRGGLM